MGGMISDPVLIKRECGGWLAVTPADAILRFGVEAADEASAIAAYEEERQRWLEIRSRSD